MKRFFLHAICLVLVVLFAGAQTTAIQILPAKGKSTIENALAQLHRCRQGQQFITSRCFRASSLRTKSYGLPLLPLSCHF